tara:strand:- start:1066 stop:1515 length:450 start_codon:yes stop_codon:yes gene_type:complete
MFDIGWPELFLIAVVVLLVVGPKELPKVLRNVGTWINKAKVVTREFRTHVDDMIRESELEEVREEINTAGQMNLEAVTENTIGLQDEIQDAVEYDDDGDYSVETFEDDLHPPKDVNASDEHHTPIEKDEDDNAESKKKNDLSTDKSAAN